MTSWKLLTLIYLLSVTIFLWQFVSVDCNDHHFDDHHFDDHSQSKHRPDDPDLSSSHEHYDPDGNHEDEFDHEAIAGSKKEAAEYQELSPEESRKRLAILVDRMDSNKDSGISKNELKEWIVSSFQNLDKENANSRLDESDENGDKIIHWAEYIHKSYGYKESEIKELENDTSEDMKNFLKTVMDEKLKFDLADVNKDGSLSVDEFTAFLHPHNYAHMTTYEVTKTLQDYDKDKDGLIDLKEFMGDGKLDADTMDVEKKHFDSLDKNKDGKLDKEEMVPWIMPGFEESAKSESEHLMKETDANKDGILTKAEILDQVELWVGSHATDYGKHLDDMKTEL